MYNVTYKTADGVIDAMNKVYGHMALAVLTSMLVSLFIASNQTLMAFIFTGIMKWITIFAPLIAALCIGFMLDKVDKPVAFGLLHGFAAIMGISLSVIFVAFKLGSVITAFGGAAILFGVMTIYGYFTKRDLTSWGEFLFIGLIAVIIASIVNVFIGNNVAQMVISAIAIIVFTGLTAYDTQKIREAVTIDNNGNAEIAGALTLYLDFINIFISMLQLFGDRKE